VLKVFVSGGDCSVSLNVTFCPTSAERCTADIYISIKHNMYEDSIVQLIGEGYVETVTIDDVSCSDDFDPPLILPPPTAAIDADATTQNEEEEDEDMPGNTCQVDAVACLVSSTVVLMHTCIQQCCCCCCYQVHSAIQCQLCALAAVYPSAWFVGSCGQYVTVL